MSIRIFLRPLCCALALIAPAFGFEPDSDVLITFQKGAVVLTVPKGVHLKKSFTEVALASKPGALQVGALPKADAQDELNEDVYHGTIRVPVLGTGLSGEVSVEVQFQACVEGAGGTCFPPMTRLIRVKAADIPAPKGAEPVPSGKGGEQAGRVSPERPDPPAMETSPLAQKLPVPGPVEPAQAMAPGLPSRPAGSQGFLLGLFLVFLAGMGASLTPCVYPMIPITMAIIGAKGGGRLKGFALSLMLVLGMAVTYTVLGVAAARSGATFGSFAQRPAFLVPVSVLFTGFALSLFGAFEIALPQGLQERLQGGGPRKGFLGAFLMGLVLGPLAAPCVGPIIGTVLVGIAQQGDAVRGGIQLFTFALGMGILFLVVGTFSAGLPRSGAWLTRFKYVMGLVVLGFAAWNVRLIVPAWANCMMWSITTLVGGAVFGAFEPAEGLTGQVRKGLAILLVVLASILGLKAVETGLEIQLLPNGGQQVPEKAQDAWGTDYEKALARAKVEHKVVLLDTFAVWCAQCKELDEKTWPDPRIAAWINEHAVPVKVDADKVRPDLARIHQIRSFPTVILLDADGREIRRSLGFKAAPEMLAWLNS